MMPFTEPKSAVTGGTLRNSTASAMETASPMPTLRQFTARRFSLIAKAKPMSAMTPSAD